MTRESSPGGRGGGREVKLGLERFMGSLRQINTPEISTGTPPHSLMIYIQSSLCNLHNLAGGGKTHRAADNGRGVSSLTWMAIFPGRAGRRGV